jgi:hypothetical protein
VAQAAFDAAGLVSVSSKTRQAIETLIANLQRDFDGWFLRNGLAQALIMSPDFQLA